MLNFFSLHGFKVPSSPEEVEEAIDAIDAKTQEFLAKDQREKTPKEKKTVEKKQEVVMDFPEPEVSKVVVEYGIFEDEGPKPVQQVAAQPVKRRLNRK